MPVDRVCLHSHPEADESPHRLRASRSFTYRFRCLKQGLLHLPKALQRQILRHESPVENVST
jgi:hypothetical protein